MGTDHYTAPDPGPKTGGGTHTAPSGANVTGLQGPPPEIRQSQRPRRTSGADRQTNSRNYPANTNKGTRTSGASRQTRSSNVDQQSFKATPSTGQITGQTAPPAAVRTASISRANARTTKTHSYSNLRFDCFGNQIDLAAQSHSIAASGVPSPTAATRKAALAKGEALPPKGGGSAGGARFPMTNKVLAARAVRMAHLAKGDQAQVRRYIMRVLRKRGWESLIPDNWTSEGQSTSK
jgi:hypothetical protein